VFDKTKPLLYASPQDGHVFLTWSEEPGADYVVRWRAERDTSWQERRIGSQTYVAIQQLKNGVRYELQLTATSVGKEQSSEIISAVPRVRDDCKSTRSIFCRVEDLRAFIRVGNFDERLLRCSRTEVIQLTIESPNCTYTIGRNMLALNRGFGGVFQAPERLPDRASVRKALRQTIWGDDDPLLSPGSLVGKWENVLPAVPGYVFIPDSLFNRAGAEARKDPPVVRTLLMHVHGSLMSRLTWFSLPDHIPGRYAIYHEGHGTPAIGGGADMINWLLQAGWQVLALDMPLDGLNGPDIRYPVFNHDDIGTLAQAEGTNALRWFFLPVAGAVDLVYDDAQKRETGVDLLMLGRSGGGWTSMVYAAMDARVDVAANISGGAPLSVFLDSTVFRPLEAHFEAETATLYDHVSETDFLLAAGTKGNFHFFSTHDPCCYWFTPAHPYIQFLESLKSRRDKKYRVFVDPDNDIHGLSTNGMTMLGKFLEEVGLKSKVQKFTPEQLAKQARDSLVLAARSATRRSVQDSTRIARDLARTTRDTTRVTPDTARIVRDTTRATRTRQPQH
jgi:hypothetical protein